LQELHPHPLPEQVAPQQLEQEQSGDIMCIGGFWREVESLALGLEVLVVWVLRAQ